MGQQEVTAGAEKEFALGVAALDADDTLTALGHLERALKLHDHPGWHSYLGYCIARERGQHRKGRELCLSSLAAEPERQAHYCNLGRVQMLSGDKEDALRALREGMVKGGSPEIIRLLDALGTRNPSVFPALSRTNPLNRYLGLLLKRLGLR
jgi:Flp pilus assembly protein TadD